MFISALVVETCAAFFSVYGLTKLFSGAAISVGIMASSLELAKVVSASYLYRYWQSLGKIFKTYLSIAIIILMFITSMGIYGFMTNAFQGSTLLLEKEVAKLNLQEESLSQIKQNIDVLKQEKQQLQQNMQHELQSLVIKENTRLFDIRQREELQTRYQKLISSKDEQLRQTQLKLDELSQFVSNSKIKMIDTGSDVGPIIFISKLFNIDISTVVQYLILLFIIVFDPLALALVIAYNKITTENQEERRDKENTDEILDENIVNTDIEEIFQDKNEPTPIRTDEPRQTDIIAEISENADTEISSNPENSGENTRTSEFPQPMQTSSF